MLSLDVFIIYPRDGGGGFLEIEDMLFLDESYAFLIMRIL
jgi:hypothetical protein